MDTTRTLRAGQKPLAGYIRVSRIGSRDSLITDDQQREALERYAASVGREVVIFEPEHDVSGAKRVRAILDEIIAGIRAGHFSGIAVYRYSRLSRLKPTARMELFELIEDELGAEIHSTAEGCASPGYPGSTPETRMARELFLALARMEWERAAEGFEDSKRRAVERGVHISGTIPVGFLRGEDGVLFPDPDKSPAIREALELRAKGSSLREIARRLGETLPGGPSGDSGRWHVGTLRLILSNPVYAGEARQGAHVNTTAHEGIVSRAIFDRVQAVNRTRSDEVVGGRGSAPKSMLAGLIFCGHCGSAMTRTGCGGQSGYRYSQYRCSGEKNAKGCATPSSAMEPKLDALVWGQAMERFEAMIVPAVRDASTPQVVRDAEAELATARTEAEALLDPRIVSSLGAERFAAMVAEADSRIAEAELVFDAAVAADTTPRVPIISRDPETVEEKREALALLIERIEVVRAPRGTALADRVKISGKSGTLIRTDWHAGYRVQTMKKTA